MADKHYLIYGSEYSPFSVKVRSYFRFKNIPHEWRVRTRDNFQEFQELAKLPLIPLVYDGVEEVLQDSTPIMEKMEERYPDNPIVPSDPALAFISYLVEEYADEWVNKPMFHFRWWRDEDQIAVANGLSETLAPNASTEDRQKLSAQIRERMVPRLSFVGSNEQNKETIELSLTMLLESFEPILKKRPYLFGGIPSFGDFGLFAQLYCCTQQPTTDRLMESYPHVLKWINRMLDPSIEGTWADWDEVVQDFGTILKSQIAGLYLPWAISNQAALKDEKDDFSVDLLGREFKQDTVKYLGRSFAILKTRLQPLKGNEKLEQALLNNDCLAPLVGESW
ncbi:glutathione S-transferase family protein [Sneathiella limimaris]|uniref:glutathione S-transferase family protein n=1 Tax=Sneathiella limimaris TaxID=1964213 RepID=UPI00146AD7A6|nr:glutathione S-transferase family protein [Sneathiella limimaris]